MLARDFVIDSPVVESERDRGPHRIVSFAPSATEFCCALGLRHRIVGRTRYCVYPPGIESVTSIGSLGDVSAETLLGLRSDLILVSGTSRMISDSLSSLGLTWEVLPDSRLDDIFASIDRLGRLCDRPQTAAALARGIREDLKAVSSHYSAIPSARVLLVIGTLADPPSAPYVAGPGSFYDELLRMAGHQNCIAQERAFGPISLEYIVKTDPEVIIELTPDDRSRANGDADARAAWSAVGPLRAVAQKRVHVLVGGEHYLPGPRIAATYAALCHAIASGDHE